MRMRFKWWQLGIVVAVAVGFMIALFFVAEIGRMRLVTAEDDVRRAQVQLARVVDLYVLLMNAESGYWGYLLTGDPRYLEPLHRADGRIQLLGNELAATYQGEDERVGAAIRQLGTAARERMDQMESSVAVYNLEGPVAGIRVANSASRHATMAWFRELAGITRDYERALMERSLANLERELLVAGRLNLATLLIGLLLAALAAIALIRNVRQRAEAAAQLERQHDELKTQFDAQATELTDLARHLQHVQEEERARLSRGLHDELGGILLAARMDVTWMERHGPGEDASVKQRLARLRNVLDQGIELKRRVVEELRPTLLDTMGLLAALRWQSEETCKRELSGRGAAAQSGGGDRAVSGRPGSPRQRGKARQGEQRRHHSRGLEPGNHPDGPRRRRRRRADRSHTASITRHRRNASPHQRARGAARRLIGAGPRHDGPSHGAAGKRDGDGGRRCGRFGDVRVGGSGGGARIRCVSVTQIALLRCP